MVPLLLRAALVGSIAWPLGVSCTTFASTDSGGMGQQHPTTTSCCTDFTSLRRPGHRDRRTVDNVNDGYPRKAQLLLGEALRSRGGSNPGAVAGKRGRREGLSSEEALSRYPSLKTPGGLVRFLDYVGTASFAMSGAATAGMRGMNLLGCLFVGVLAATGGGTLRDLLLGQTPVFWLVEAEYVGICVVTALVTFVLWPVLSRVSLLSHMGTGMDGWLSQAIDTIGLASFAVAGTQHGIRRACHPGITIVICCITCSGGGIMRDVLTRSEVAALSSHAQMYVSTTAFGSAAYLYTRGRSTHPLVRICAGFFTVIVLRIVACAYDLRLPVMV